jgi:two-component system sensor histidine kinase ArlS
VKLSTKLIYFIAGSKLAVVLLFILSLPFLVDKIASEYTNISLRDQQKKVISIVEKNGIDYYLQGNEDYGSYTMLKEEYIALEPAPDSLRLDTIKTSERIVEQDTLNYRVLSYTFHLRDKNYLLEIGKTTGSISQYNKPLQRIALYVLMGLLALTLIIDLVFTRILIRPLGKIIETKLINRKFPFKNHARPIKTSTQDFKYLDESLMLLMDQINIDFEKEREFTANASHELMTPISILQNKMENLLADEEVTEELAPKIVGMMKTLDRLKKISSSLLLISRIDNEQFVKKEALSPRDLINEIMEEISHRLEEKNIRIYLNVSEKAVIKTVNKDLLFQMFYNLIHNAIKFNKVDGSIVIEDRHLKNGAYEITVENTGRGISKEHLPLIFNRFRKTNGDGNVGYGLGLAIVKSIALYHHIDLSAKSEVGKSTSFSMKFPKEN